MYRTLNLILKNTRGIKYLSNLATKGSRYITTSCDFRKTNLLGHVQSRGFSEQEQKFSRISGRESQGLSKVGKLNIRRVCLKEPTVPFLRFIEENTTNMNDYDYIDAIYLLAQKIEETSFRKISVANLDKYKGFHVLKNWTESNFDLMIKDNFAKFSFLYLLSQLAQKNRQRIFLTREQETIILDANLQTLESGKLSLLSILNTVTLLSNFRQLNLDSYLKGREADISKLQWRAIYKVLKRLTNPRMSRYTKVFLVKFLNFEFFNMIATQPMEAKAKAFNMMANIEWEVPFLNIHSKLTNLLKDIKNNAENHDQTSILQVCEGLHYYQDSLTIPTLKDLCDIVSMTIKHQPDNLRPEFVLKFIELLSQIKNQNVVSHENITVLLDYLNEKLGEKQIDSYDFNRMLTIFTLMKKNKYFQKEQTAKLLDLIFPKLDFLNMVNADVKNFRFIVGKVLGAEFQEKLAKEIVNLSMANIKSKPDFNVYQGLRILSKVGIFSQSSEVEEISDLVVNKLDEVSNTVDSAVEFLDSYVNRFQEFLVPTQRKKIVEKVLRYNVEDYNKVRNTYKLYFNLNELYVPKDQEEVKTKIQEILKSISSRPEFKKNLLFNFTKLVNEGHTVSNLTVFKVTNFLRQYLKDEEFLKDNQFIVERLVMLAFNLLYNAEDEASVSHEAVVSVLNLADKFAEANPTLKLEISPAKIPATIRTFNTANLNSNVINQLALQYLQKFKFNPDSLISNYIIVLEKVIKSDLPKEPINEIIRRDFKSEDDFFEIFSRLKEQSQIQLFNISSLANKKGFEVFTDNLIQRVKNHMNETVLNNKNISENLRFYYLFTLPFVKQSIVDFQNEKKNYNQSFKDLYENTNLRKLVRYYDNLPSNNRNSLIVRMYFELANAYEKEEKVDKITLLKVLDKITAMKYISNSFYNKVISDLEKLFNTFNTQEFQELIVSFSRIEMKKDDVIKACVKQIQLKFLNDQERVVLFNALVKLDYTNAEWKEMFLSKLIQDVDMNSVFNKLSLREKMWFLINLWKLQEWPENREELINQCVASIRMKIKDIDRNYVQFLIRNEDWVTLLYRSPIFEKFDEEIKSQITSIFNMKREKELKRLNFKYVVELLKAMGHTEIEVLPAKKLCDVYLPKEKVGITLITKLNLNFANTEEINCTGEFIKEVLKKEGDNPVLLSFLKLKNSSQNVKDSIKYLNSLNVPSLVQDDQYDISAALPLWNKLNAVKPRNEKTPANPEEANANEDEKSPQN